MTVRDDMAATRDGYPHDSEDVAQPRPDHPRPIPDAERIQREYELGRAHAAAKHLEELLELAGLDSDAARARRIREDIAHTFGLIREETTERIVEHEGLR